MVFSIYIVIIIGFLLRIFVAVWNGFFGPSPGADLDAIGLHGFASNVAQTGILDEFTIGYIPYTNLLGLIYNFTTSHIFIGSIFSCLAWLTSAHILYKIFIIFGTNKNQTRVALLLYSLIPSTVLFTAITIREPYQLLFVNIAIYSIARIILNSKSLYYILLFFSIFCFGVLHGALLAFGILLASGVLITHKLENKNTIFSAGFIFTSIIIVSILWLGLSIFSNLAYNIDSGLDSSIQAYQQALLGVDARTNYKSEIPILSLSDLIFFIPAGLFQYLFEPLPWRVSTTSDVILFFENILRFFLIWKAFKLPYIEDLKKRRFSKFMLISYFLIEVIWSVGTINWGTSVRHHLPAYGFLLLAAFTSTKVNISNIQLKTLVSARNSIS